MNTPNLLISLLSFFSAHPSRGVLTFNHNRTCRYLTTSTPFPTSRNSVFSRPCGQSLAFRERRPLALMVVVDTPFVVRPVRCLAVGAAERHAKVDPACEDPPLGIGRLRSVMSAAEFRHDGALGRPHGVRRDQLANAGRGRPVETERLLSPRRQRQIRFREPPSSIDRRIPFRHPFRMVECAV